MVTRGVADAAPTLVALEVAAMKVLPGQIHDRVQAGSLFAGGNLATACALP